MVTSRERDYMYQSYAADARARLNLGIRRRLAPLLENDPERIKLMNSLLLSMPGAPIIYYGDELGMGDNFFLGDRNGLRTPMQWSPDRNAGFSRADPQQLYLPPIMDPVYGYQAVNVESQTRDRSSLLNWMKRMLQVRRSSQAFGRGTLRFIRPGNRRVLVYLRQYGEDTILCVANLSRSAQPVELDLAEHKAKVPIELLGRSAFPPIGELPYLLTLPGYAFYWFLLSREAKAPPWHDERTARDDLPMLVLIEGWRSFFPERVAPWRAELAKSLRAQLEGRVVPGFLATQRWAAPAGAPARGAGAPAARGAGASGAALVDWVLPEANHRWLAAIFEVKSGAQAGQYVVPLALAFEDTDEARYRKLLPSALARVRQHAATGILADAAQDEDFCRAIIEAIGAQSEFPMHHGSMRCGPTSAFARLHAAQGAGQPVVSAGAQGGNTTVRVGDGFFLKFCRRLRPGVNPGVQIGRYLTEVARFPHSVPLAGCVEYHRSDGAVSTLALLQAFVTNQGDGWDYTVNYLVRFLEERVTHAPLPADAHGLYLALVRTLATRTAQLHAALAAATQDPELAPEPLTAADVNAQRAETRSALNAALEVLAKRAHELPPGGAADASEALARRAALLRSLGKEVARAPKALKIRCHGDYHLRQVLLKRNDFVITDFEGSPQQSAEELTERKLPFTDVAGMLRSFGYARHRALEQCLMTAPAERDAWERQLDDWERQTREVFISTYDELARDSGLYQSFEDTRPLLRLLELERACLDLQQELTSRPEWAEVPLRTLAAQSI